MAIENCTIGVGTKIWNPELSNIYGCEIGEDCNIGALVEIRKAVKIGDRCKVQPFCFICEGVHIENDVFIGPHVCFTNDKRPTVEGFNDYRETYIENHVNIGANVTVLCGVRIGQYATIGAGSVVTHDVHPYTTVVGNPAKLLIVKEKKIDDEI